MPDLYDDEIPDLSAIPQDEWRAILEPLTEWDRRRAAARIQDEETRNAAKMLVAIMLGEPSGVRTIATPQLPAPGVAGGPPRMHQVNFRVTETQFARLCDVARDLGLRPTTLARLMVIRGVDASLREQAAREA